MKLTLLSAMLLSSTAAFAGELFAYIGSYTGGGSTSKGITLAKFDTGTGAIKILGTAAELQSPSFLALHPDGTHLYAVSESGNSAAAFKVDKATGLLTKLNELSVGDKPGQGACHLCVVPGAKMLVTANYGGGSTTTFSLADDGSLKERTGFIQHTGSSVNPGRQKEPHGHGAVLSADGKHVLVNDLGTDRIYVYAVDAAKSTLNPKPVSEGVLAPGSGPRHGAFSGNVFYCINEMLLTVTPFVWDANKATLTPGATLSTVPEGISRDGFSTAEIVAHPNGKFLYGSNRGHNSIACYQITDPAKGTLKLLEIAPAGVKTPRNFNLTPDGKWLLACGQDSNDIAVFAIGNDGKLKPTPHRAETGKPVCIVFLPGK
jgi:6-phosphogluconolactonase